MQKECEYNEIELIIDDDLETVSFAPESLQKTYIKNGFDYLIAVYIPDDIYFGGTDEEIKNEIRDCY